MGWRQTQLSQLERGKNFSLDHPHRSIVFVCIQLSAYFTRGWRSQRYEILFPGLTDRRPTSNCFFLRTSLIDRPSAERFTGQDFVGATAPPMLVHITARLKTRDRQRSSPTRTQTSQATSFCRSKRSTYVGRFSLPNHTVNICIDRDRVLLIQ